MELVMNLVTEMIIKEQKDEIERSTLIYDDANEYELEALLKIKT